MQTIWRLFAITAAATGPERPRYLLALALLLLAATALAGHQLELRVGSVHHPQIRLDDLRIHLAVPVSGRIERGQITVQSVTFADQQLGPARLVCGRLDVSLPQMNCRDGDLSLEHPDLGIVRLQGSLRHGPRGTQADFQGTLNERPVRLRLQWKPDGVMVQLRLESLAAERLAEFLPEPGWHMEGEVDLSLSAELEADGTATGTVVLTGRDIALSSPDGAIATDSLAFTAIAGLQGDPGEQRGTLRLLGNAGLAYVDPVLLNLDDYSGDLLANLIHRDGRVWLEQLRLRQPGLLQAHGQASLSWTPEPALHSLNLRVEDARLPQAYSTFLQPFLIGTVLDSLDTGGRVTGELDVRDGQPVSASMRLHELSLEDQRERFALRGLSGDIRWLADADAAPPPSRLRWQSGQAYRVHVGAGELDAILQGDSLRLRRPLRLPVEDGALRLDRLEIRGLGSEAFAATLEGRLEPISLEALSGALGWPELQGTVSGAIPQVTYRNRQLALDDALQARVFDGSVHVDRFRLTDPLGRFPQLQADIRLRGLDLELITGTFAFGRITGRLDGDVQGLELLDWEPVAFDARLHTPASDRSTRRISQRAIENISDLGAGGTALLSGTVLRFFDDFRYRQLGIRCVLRDNVCHMSGIRPEGDGYILVQGSGVPRVDVIGFTQAVSWPTLLEQLQAVTQ